MKKHAVKASQKTKLGEKITELKNQRQLTNSGIAHMMQIPICELEDIIDGNVTIDDQICQKLEYVFGIRKNVFKKLARQDESAS